MIQANQWYNIAATQITPSKTGMNITLGAFSIRCNISVDWGNATITIVDALTSSAKISLRIRSLGGDFFADVKASSVLDGEIVAVLYDNNYWSAPPVTVASGGDTVCIINDVSEYIPGGGSGGDSQDINQLKAAINANAANISTLSKEMERVKDWFELKTLSDGTKVLVTKYNLATEKNLAWGGSGGVESNPGSGSSYNRLDSWDGYTDAMAGYVLSAGLGYSLKQAIENISSNNSPSEVIVKVGSVAYNSVGGVVSLPAYPTIPAKLSAFTDDVVSGNYLPLAGGVLSGALSVPNINITSAAAVAHLAFGRQGGNFITAPTGGYLAFVAEGKGIATASADLVVTDAIVYPGTDGVTQLGFGGKRWSKVSSIDGEFAGALTAGTFSTANVVSCGGRLRVNASNSVTSFGFLKATAYTTALNRAVLDIGSNYGGSSDIASETVDVVAMSLYRGAVGVGRAFTYDELYANRASNVMLSVEGNAQATGSITAAFFNGNATSATKLATARSIYGQTFDGRQDITSAKVINFTDAESYSANESDAARVGRFDTNGGLKIQLGNSDDAVIEIVNKGATIALLRMDASGNLRVKGNLIVEGNLTWGGAL